MKLKEALWRVIGVRDDATGFNKQALNLVIEATESWISVVRCMDCELWEYDDDYENVGKCNYFSSEKLVHLTKTSDYCSQAERRDEE